MRRLWMTCVASRSGSCCAVGILLLLLRQRRSVGNRGRGEERRWRGVDGMRRPSGENDLTKRYAGRLCLVFFWGDDELLLGVVMANRGWLVCHERAHACMAMTETRNGSSYLPLSHVTLRTKRNVLLQRRRRSGSAKEVWSLGIVRQRTATQRNA